MLEEKVTKQGQNKRLQITPFKPELFFLFFFIIYFFHIYIYIYTQQQKAIFKTTLNLEIKTKPFHSSFWNVNMDM